MVKVENENNEMELIMTYTEIDEWKEIEGHTNKYRINCEGEIQRYDANKNEWVIKTQKIHNKYFKIRIAGKEIPVHRLVALAFIENPENKDTVDHINGNKECNCAGNLRWLYNRENGKAHADRVAYEARMKKNENQNSENHANTDNKNDYVPPSPTCKHWDQCTKKDKNGSIK